jgi:hypothetical protein
VYILSYTENNCSEKSEKEKKSQNGLEENGKLCSKNVQVIIVVDSFLYSLSVVFSCRHR